MVVGQSAEMSFTSSLTIELSGAALPRRAGVIG